MGNKLASKVQIFREGHTIWKTSPNQIWHEIFYQNFVPSQNIYILNWYSFISFDEKSKLQIIGEKVLWRYSST